MKGTYNPGNLHVRLGSVLSRYEESVYNRDLETAASMLDIAESYCRIHLDDAQKKKLDKMPGFSWGDDRQPNQVFRDMNARLTYTLDCVKDHGIFTRAQVEILDADAEDTE